MKLVGERRALASAILIFYGLVYLLLALIGAVEPEMRPAITALGAVYVAAFFALVAGYFWARWFAIGVALFGVITGAVGLWKIGLDEQVLFIGGTHLAVVLLLWGQSMAGPYDAQKAWRERFHIDENAAHRLGKAIIRAGVSLPMVLLYALAPKGSSTLELVVAFSAATLATGGLVALIRLRTWGIAALGGAGVLCAIAAADPSLSTSVAGIDASGAAAAAAVTLLVAVAPFARPLVRALHRA